MAHRGELARGKERRVRVVEAPALGFARLGYGHLALEQALDRRVGLAPARAFGEQPLGERLLAQQLARCRGRGIHRHAIDADHFAHCPRVRTICGERKR
jgi:hypothetical protein